MLTYRKGKKTKKDNFDNKYIPEDLPLIRSEIKYKFQGGIPSDIWGPSAWTFKHAIALQSNVSEDSEARYYYLTKENLPCTICEEAYNKFLYDHPYQLLNQTSSVLNKDEKQLAKLFYKCHNNINKEKKKDLLSYEENVNKFKNLSPKIWLYALIDYLLALALHQISWSTEIYLKKKQIKSSEQTDFYFSNLLPIHKLIYFLLNSNFLSSVHNKHVDLFIQAATSGKSSLLAIKLYDIKSLRNRTDLTYLAEPFVKRLERILCILNPDEKNNKLLKHRIKLFYSN